MPLKPSGSQAGRSRNIFLFSFPLRENGRWPRTGRIVASLLLALLPLFAQAQSWYNSAWQYRKSITIDKAKVGSGPHTNFPVLISITDAQLKAGALSSGNDILFTSSDGTTKLAHEIESYSSTTGTLTAWVEIPSLSSSANTVLYMYYGNASAGSQQNVSGTWSASYQGVYHFNGGVSDASPYGRNGNSFNTSSTTGKIGLGRNFNPAYSSSYVSISGLMGNPASVTLSGWAYLTAYDVSGAGLVSLGDYSAMRMTSGGATGFFYNGSSWPNTGNSTDYSGAWHYFCYTFASGGYSQKLYVDGVQVASSSNGGSISYSGLGSNTIIGKHGNGNTGMDFKGTMDEVRVASSARSAGWIQTEYNNQSDPSSFYAVGNCESKAPTVTSPVAYCQNASATQLTASGTSLLWGLGSVSGSCGGSSTLSSATWVDASWSNQKTLFSTLSANVMVTSVDYYIPAWNAVNGLQLAIFNSSGTPVAISSTVTSLTASSTSLKVTSYFNTVLSAAGSYSIGVYSGGGNLGGDAPAFPINEATGTLRVTGKSASYRCFNNIQFDAGGSATAPTPSTASVGSTSYTVLQSPNGCSSTPSTITVNVTGTVATPGFSMGSTSTRCQSAGSVTYTATAANNTGITYSLDATSLAAGNTINTATGQVTYISTWAGVSTITATASGCSGPKSATHRATTTALSASATTTRTCVGGSTGAITVTASGGSSPYTYSINGGAYQSGNSFSGLAAGTYSISAKSSIGCLGSTSVSVLPYDTSSGNQNAAGSDAWIGHVYDGTSFSAYYGYYNEAESFNQGFGGNTNCFALRSGADTNYIYTETFSVKYRMNSTRRGLYAVDLGSDDGSRLTVDGTMVYNNWSDQSFSTKANVLLPLTGSSSLLYEFYENGGGNQVAFQNLRLLAANTLSANTTQSVCMGNSGAAISGDTIATLPAGITASGTGYQWSYSTTPNGTRTSITGATGASFTPSTLSAPFNVAGTYYVFRTVSLTSTTNVSPNPYTASLESGAAVITVNPVPSAAISYAGSPYCNSSSTATITRTGTTGGTYSSTTGLSINASTGTINPSASTPGTYTVTYTIAASGGCSVYTTTTSVTITEQPATDAYYPASPYCSNGGIVYPTATILKGAAGTLTYTTGLVIDAYAGVNLAASTPGNHTVTYTVPAGGGCPQYVHNMGLTISTAPSATISYAGSPYCSNAGTASVTLTGTTGGTFSSTSGLSLNATTGAINLAASTPGSYTVTYTVAASGGCALYQITAPVVITAQPSATISYTGTPYCSSSGTATVTLAGTTGGTFSSTAGLSIDSSTGAVNLAASTPGTYTVTYAIAASGGCSAYTATTGITITEQPAINGYYAGSPYCSNAGTAYPTITLVKGAPGTMTYTPGLVVDAYGGVNLGASTPGTHTLTYTVPAGGGCAQYVYSTNLTITTAPAASISYPGSPYPTYGGTASVSLSGTTGGSFSAGAGLSINAATGAINLAASTPGTYTVTYSIAAGGGCGAFSATAVVTVVQRNLFRSIASGPWNQSSTWELSTNGGAIWAPSGITPASSTDTVTISSSHTVTVPVNIQPSLLRISANATLAPDSTIFISGNGTLDGSGIVRATMQGKDFSTQYSIFNKNLNALTVDYAAAGPQFISALSYYRLTVSNTAAGVAPQGNFSVSDTMNVVAGAVLNGGSYTVSGTGVLAGNGTVQVKATGNSSGDFAAQFPIARKQLTNLTVEFSGAARQMLDTLSFAKLTVNNASGLQLAGAASVDSLLTFSNGLLILDTNNLTLGANISIGGSPSASSMVVTNGSGELRKKMTAIGSFLFPVGDNTGTPEYSPATLSQTSGSFPANAYISVRVVNAKHPANNAKANYLNRYWAVGRSGVSGNCSGVFQYLPADVVGSESQIYLGRYTPSVAALWTTLTVASASDHTLSAAAYNGVADYTGTDRSCGVYNYRSRANGSWSSKNTWEASIDGGATWFNGGSYPGTDFDTVRVQSPHTVTGNISVNPSLLTIDSGGILSPSSGAIYGGNGNMSGTGTIRVSRTTGTNEFFTQYAIANLDVSRMTVEYTGNAAQDVGAAAYGTLSIKGTGLKTLQSGTAAMKDLMVDTPSSFTVKGTLQIAGGIASAGILNVAAATVEMNGGAAQTIPANTFSGHLVQNFVANNSAGISLSDTMLLSGIFKAVKGTFHANGLLTLTSNASGTALIDGSGAGNVTGLVTMQRYLPSGFGYRYISSPFTAAHVSELYDDLSLTDSFATLYRYDENVNHAGWIKYTDSSQTLQPLAGYAANFGALSTPKTISISGTVNNGPLSTALYNHNQTYTLGFNLVGNPYPSPIDWNAPSGWTKTNVDDAIYYFDNGVTDRYQGAYSSFVNGVSSNGIASNVIASMQGFFVHVSNGSYPVSATLGMTNAVRVNDLLPVYHKQLSAATPLVRLSAGFEDAAGFADPTVVYFDAAAQDAFERDRDAVKMFNTDARVPSLYSVSGGLKMAINAQPLPGDLTQNIPLGLSLDRDGTVVFRRCDMEDIPAGLRVYFADAARGQIQDLEQMPEYKTTLSKGSYDNRFYLLFSREEKVVIPGAEELDAFMRGNTVVVTLRDAQGEVVITNALGQVMQRRQLQGKGMHEVPLTVTPGVYIISLSTSNGVKSKKLFVGGE